MLRINKVEEGEERGIVLEQSKIELRGKGLSEIFNSSKK